MYLSKENTWTQHLRKDQYIGASKTIKDPLIRQSQEFLSEKFNDFEYTNDAIFESFRDYPRKKQLYRKHKDIAKDYERKVKFYKSCQRWYSTESNRQIQKVEERFTKLLHYTYESNPKKTKGLQVGYSKWISTHGKPTDSDRTFENTTHLTCEAKNIDSQEEKVPVPVTSPERAHSIRSVSVGNIPKLEENFVISGARDSPKTHVNDLRIHTSLSNLDIAHTSKDWTRHGKHYKNVVKISSN